MNADSPLSMLRSMYEHYKRPVPLDLIARQIPVLHEAIFIRSQEVQRILDAETEESEGRNFFSPQSSTKVGSTLASVNEAEFRQSMLLSAKRAAPFAKVLNSYQEQDRQSNGGKYESADKLIDKLIHEPEAREFAMLVAAELQSLNIDIVGGEWWMEATFPDGCTAFWVACPGKSPADNWKSYGLIDFMEGRGTVVPGEVVFAISSRGIELIGFILSVFGQRHFHMP